MPLPKRDTRLEDADTRTDQANTRTRQANTRTHEAETQTEQANTRTDEANTRTKEAEARTDAANSRTDLANTRTDQANTRTDQANTRTEEAEARSVEALKASGLLYRRLFETAQDGILILDADTGQVVDANPFMKDLLGYSQEEFLGRKLWEIGPFKGEAASKIAFAELQLADRLRYEGLPLETKDGLRVEVEFITNAYFVDQKRLIQCNIRNITERKRAEAEILRLNETLEERVAERTTQLQEAYSELQGEVAERMRTADELKASFKEIGNLKSALDEHAIVAITDSQGKITYVNDKFCAISKYTREELLGQDHRIINSGFHSKEFIRELWTTITHGKVWKGEIKNRAKDGSFYWVDTTIVPFLDELGKPRQYVAIRADITERKAAEHIVVERTTQLEEANKELQAFSYSVSHDLRAPLRHVLGFVEMLQKGAGPSLSEKNLGHLTTISRAAKRMGNLIDDLLAFSRVGRADLQKTNVDLDQLVRETMKDFQTETKERNIAWEIHPLPHVRADPALLQMVLVNLLSNAVKFTGNRAEAKIEIGSVPDKNGKAAIFIRDNGAGFNLKYAEKLFGVFQRLHSHDEFEGTGIGLANVQRIITRHGGRVWAEGVVDGGATFYFSIPNHIEA
ncbi:MAG TPA: PAS domain S-box protein [Candidatus Methylacidiphilales bacterium]|nr:PAS domain S-box protein [Candidatus Methylacidiphilales bacterium]